MLPGATLSLYIESFPQTANLVFTFCEFEQWRKMFNYETFDTYFCKYLLETSGDSKDRERQCLYQFSFNDTLSFYTNVTDYGKYMINLSNCDQKSDGMVNVTYETILKNPLWNGRYTGLSGEFIPLTFVFAIATVVWSFIALYWMRILCCSTSTGKSLKTIHLLLIGYTAIKLFSSAYSYRIFTYSLYEKMKPIESFFYSFLQILYRTYLAYLLLMFSHGWKLLTTSLSHEIYNIFAIVFGYSCILVFKYYYVSLNSLTYYLFIEILYQSAKAFVYFYMWININSLVETLGYRIRNPDGEDSQMTPAQKIQMIRKYKLFVDFRGLVMAWVILCIYEFLISFLYYGGLLENWIVFADYELLDVILLVGISYIFRPRPLSSNILIPVDYRLDLNEHDNPIRNIHNNENTNTDENEDGEDDDNDEESRDHNAIEMRNL
ncbi:hypothetical protein DLAC_02202 [Tieghemostelium lacteum]|uniref:Uncharacterized protein n=1 Tax=Tieghemostelium lacteum TaxID=361077 RepID=A0A152A4D3_TIELA|nr:hypothetical protein DLAC_02202 [Tieghemostelium lacteum]|eukprot:KYR01102.1 hypothetical protein DLAC_02202 [Tieghemostelium lacteum]